KTGGKGDGAQPIRDLDSVRGFLSGIGPIALFDLPWMPVYLVICFLFHTYIGLTALVGAIILVTRTALTELATPRRSRPWAWSAASRSAGTTSTANTSPLVSAPAMSPADSPRCRRFCA